MSRLENDCLAILKYAAREWPRWVPITEITEEQSIPPSTIRTILCVADRGVFVKYGDGGCTVHSDVFDKIAKKFRIEYSIKKMLREDGRLTWHISAVCGYYTPYNNL